LPEACELRRVPWDEADFKKKVEDLQAALALVHHRVTSVADRKKYPKPGEVEVSFSVCDYVLPSTESASKLHPHWGLRRSTSIVCHDL
jgi:hypothetical protein